MSWCGVWRNTTVSSLGLVFFRFRDTWCFTGWLQPLASPPTCRTSLSIYMTPGDGWPRYTPRHWVARDVVSVTSRTCNDFVPEGIKAKFLEYNLSQCYCFHHKSHMVWSGIELVLHNERPTTICLRHGTVSLGLKNVKLAVETDEIILQYFEVLFYFLIHFSSNI